MAKVFCKKFNKELDALMLPPIPGPKGEHIKDNFSQKAWNEWVSLQTMLINEKHLMKLGSYGLLKRFNILKNLETSLD